MTARFQLRDFGTSFASRGRGAELRTIALDSLHGGDALIVDLSGVEQMSYSFADEFLAKLNAENPISVHYENGAPSVARTVDSAMARRTGAPVSC